MTRLLSRIFRDFTEIRHLRTGRDKTLVTETAIGITLNACPYPAASSSAPCLQPSPRNPPPSTAATSSRATTPRCTGSTRAPLSLSATANSPSPPTPRACRPFPNLTNRRCRSARNRSGDGTPRPTQRAKARPIYASPNSTPSAAKWATPHRATGKDNSSIGFAKTRTAFTWAASDLRSTSPTDVRFIQQTLDLWTGTLHSEFEWHGQKITVATCCHPTDDMIAVTVRGRIPVVFEFPYGSSAMNAADWTHPEKHTTRQQSATPNRLDLERRLDADTYTVSIAWPETPAAIKQESTHRFVLTPTTDRLAFCCSFRPQDTPPATLPPRLPPPKSSGPRSGTPAPRSISPARPIHAPANWSAASSSLNT